MNVHDEQERFEADVRQECLNRAAQLRCAAMVEGEEILEGAVIDAAKAFAAFVLGSEKAAGDA